MRTKSNNSLGAIHPVLFFAGVYAVALFFSIFICSIIFYSCNSTGQLSKTEKKKQDTEVAAPVQVVASLP